MKPDKFVHPNRKAVRRGMNLNILACFFGTIWFMIAQNGMPLTMMLEALGASGVAIGLVATINLVAMLGQIVGSLMVEKLPRRKPFWFITAMISRVVWVLPVFMLFALKNQPQILIWGTLTIVTLSAISGQLSCAPWLSWTADLVPEHQSSGFWSKRQGFFTVSALIAFALSGYVLDLFPKGNLNGFLILFSIAAFLGILDTIVHGFVPEPPVTPATDGASLRQRLIAPFKNRDFLFFTLAIGIWTFGLGLIGPFWMVYLKQVFNVLYAHISTILVMTSIGGIIASFTTGLFIARTGARTYASTLLLVAPLFNIVWFLIRDTQITLLGGFTLPQPILLLLIVNTFQAGVFASFGVTQLHMLTALAPKEGRTMAMAMHSTLAGLLGAIGPLLGGVIKDQWSAISPEWVLPNGTAFSWYHLILLIHTGLLGAVALPLMLAVRRPPKEMCMRSAITNLILVNPLRTVRDVYNISLATNAVARKQKTNAIIQLGKSRTKIAIADLITKLNDPASAVREQAAWSLGQIGSPEAIDALLWKLDDPHSDIGPQVARALRQKPHPCSVDTLVRKLEDTEKETIAESAKTLGHIDDDRARSSLLKLLKDSREDKIIAASSEALSQLGEITAIHEILPRMQQTQNPLLKRSLAVAIGDLIGRPEGFYKMLTSEETEPGTAVSRRLTELRKRINKKTKKELPESAAWLSSLCDQLEKSYEEQNYPACGEHLFNIAISLAAISYGERFGNDAKAFIDELLWQDKRFGMIVWFIYTIYTRLKETGQLKQTETLLGIYALSQWEREPRSIA